MENRLTRLIVLLALAGCPSNWRTRDTALEVGLVGVTAVDWYQTMDITKNCNESNPIIGPCGERVNMHLYFASVVLIQMVAGRIIPSHWRSFLHGAGIGAETAIVIENEIE